jgi:hypothetical protein
MPAMTPMRALRILLALALLGAQQLALSHQIWHAGKDGSQPAQKQLCVQHDALGTVAGALDAPIAAFAGETPATSSFVCLALPSASTPRLAPSSRGPPALL